MYKIRGGDDATTAADIIEKENADAVTGTVDNDEEEDEALSLEERVHAAMRKLGLSVDDDEKNESTGETNGNLECKDGVCTIKDEEGTKTTSPPKQRNSEDIHTVTKRIAKEMDVDESIAFAAIGATLYPAEDDDANENSRINVDAAKEMIQYEVDAIQRVMEDCEEVSEKNNGRDLVHI